MKYTGRTSTNYGNDELLVMVHPSDIAAAAAKELADPSSAAPRIYIR